MANETDTSILPGVQSYQPEKKRNPFRPGREYSDNLQARMESAFADPSSLGMSESEMEQAAAAAQQQAMASQQAAVMQMNQSALAANPFKAGALAEAARNVSDEGEAAAAKATASIRSTNDQMIEQRMKQLQAELVGLRDHRTDMYKFAFDTALSTATAVAEMAKDNAAAAGSAATGVPV